MLTNDELAEIRELAEKATAGPWERFECYSGSRGVRTSTFRYFQEIRPILPPDDNGKLAWQHAPHDQEEWDNLKFISASRTAIPALLADREELAAEVARLRAEKDRYKQTLHELTGYGGNCCPCEQRECGGCASDNDPLCDDWLKTVVGYVKRLREELSTTYERLDGLHANYCNSQDAAMRLREIVRKLVTDSMHMGVAHIVGEGFVSIPFCSFCDCPIADKHDDNCPSLDPLVQEIMKEGER